MRWLSLRAPLGPIGRPLRRNTQCISHVKPGGSISTTPKRLLANVREVPELWFRSGAPLSQNAKFGDHQKPNERTVKLGKTIRILHERMPDLLASPLPQDILSPSITLRLFPSTHPHLPSVTGRLKYTAALWTSPVAWGGIPVVGNVKLVMLSERMIHSGGSNGNYPANGEKLVVRWKTCGRGEVFDQLKRMFPGFGRSNGASSNKLSNDGKDEDFHGLFIFEFDSEGRIASHTIEHVEQSNHWERTAKVVSVTDWLLGKAWGNPAKDDDGVPGLAYCENGENGRPRGGGRKRD